MGVYSTGSLPDKFQEFTRQEVTGGALMLLSISMQDDTHGVAGGVGLGSAGTYYTSDGKTFNPSSEEGIMIT